MCFVSMRRVALALVFGLAGSVLAADGDWPTWRGAKGNSSAHALAPLALGKPGYGLVPAWSVNIGSSYASVSVVGKRAITMGSDGTREYTICLDADSGKELWRYDMDVMYKGHDTSHDGPNSTPVIDGDQVFSLSASGALSAIALETGKLQWKRHLTDDFKAVPPFHGYTTVPVVSGNILAVQTGGESAIVGLDRKTGKTLWTLGQDTLDYQSPILIEYGGQTQIVAHGRAKMCGIEPNSGKLLWEQALGQRDGGLNALFLPPNRLFLGGNGANSVMFELGGDAQATTIKEVWRSRELTRSFNVPVYHQGYLYGFTGQFLVCLDAKTGEQAWKSRAPGDGFAILVDDFLVIQTKAGSVHVARASASGYEEVASLPAFDSLSWTPPSFAHDRVFARNLTTAMALKVDQVDQARKVVTEIPSFRISGTKFAAFVDDLEKATDKQAKLDAYMSAHPTSPVIEDGKYVHFIYRGDVKDLTLVGDIVDTDGAAQMIRVAGTDLYYASFEVPPKARLSYRFVVNFDNPSVDPRNPVKVNGILGEFSELTMPGYVPAADLAEPKGPRGKLENFDLASTTTGDSKQIAVYLPPGYEQGDARYPVVYVNYGLGARNFGLMTNTLDNLIGKTIKPVIAVFIESPNSGAEYARNLRDTYAAFVAKELTARIDSSYRTVPKPEGRLFMGADEGGFAALYTALSQQGVFAMAAGQSTHMLQGAGNEEMMALIAGPAQPVSIYLGYGTHEYRSKAAGYDWTQLNQELVKALQAKGYKVTAEQQLSGWDWPSWRQYTHRILEHFFQR